MLSSLPSYAYIKCKIWSHLDFARDIADQYDTLLTKRKMQDISQADDSVLNPLTETAGNSQQLSFICDYFSQSCSLSRPAQPPRYLARDDLKSYHGENINSPSYPTQPSTSPFSPDQQSSVGHGHGGRWLDFNAKK